MDINTQCVDIKSCRLIETAVHWHTLAYYQKAIISREMRDYSLRYSYVLQTRYAHMDCFSRQHNGDVA